MNEWQKTGDSDPRSLTDARLQLHHAAQVVSAIGHTLLDVRPDDIHRSLSWSDGIAGFHGEPLPARNLRGALTVEDLTLRIVGGDHRSLRELGLHERTLAEALRWMTEEIGLLCDGPVNLKLPNLPDFPAHAVWNGAEFQETAGMAELGKYYSNANKVFEAIAKGTVPVRVWPHHFDIAILLPGLTEPQSVGVGLSPGDNGCQEPYWYVTPWPSPQAAILPPLAAGGTWNTAGWIGAILPASKTSGKTAGEQEKQVDQFISSALDAARVLLSSQ